MTSPGATPTRLSLVRHGESEVTVRRVIGGRRTCSGLSDLGRQQAEALRTRLLDDPLDVDVLVSSDFARAVETAEIIAPSLPGAGQAFPRLAGWGEHDPGPELDGMTFSAYVERFGTPDWDGDPDTVVFPGGETTRQFHDRVHGALDDLLAEHAGRSVLVSCHGGVVDAVFRRLLGLPMTGGFELHTLNASVTVFEQTAGSTWRLARYNDAAHLAGLPDATPRHTNTSADPGAATDRIVATSE